MIEGRKSIRNERRSELIVEKWYYVFVFVMECGLSNNSSFKKSRSKEPKSLKALEPKSQRA